MKLQAEKAAAQRAVAAPSRLQSAVDIADAATSLGMSKACCDFFMGQLRNCNRARKGSFPITNTLLYGCNALQCACSYFSVSG